MTQRRRRSRLAVLQATIEQRPSVPLTAEPGVGKSYLARRLASQLHPGRIRTTLRGDRDRGHACCLPSIRHTFVASVQRDLQ
jgi:hypothetical protein